MEIHSMVPEQIERLMRRVHFGRLACANDGQPYITYINFALDGDCLYGFTTLGQKIQWMRKNTKVCVAFDDIKDAWHWQTVLVMGTYEELINNSELSELRKHAYNLLRKNPLWWEPGFVKTVIDGHTRPLEGVYFRIHIVEKTGHRTAGPD
jgi:nitroimidazol reductase NimA-like FMN-containing flavoprotein (pyridoxamine 5'-phosphate oxidase superfamily)